MNFSTRQKFYSAATLLAVLLCIVIIFSKVYDSVYPPTCPYVWHGGSPTIGGSCWCGVDKYCMCTPSLAIDCIIEYRTDSSVSHGKYVVLVWRQNPPKDLFAIPGGFVDVGETAEMATIREVKEETNLTISHMEQFKLYSDPGRDLRRHTASMVFRCIVDSIEFLHTGDDAKSVKVVELESVLSLNLAFDHKLVLRDFIERYHPHILMKSINKTLNM